MASFTLDATLYNSDGYVLVDWTSATLPTSFFLWRVYRRPLGEAWELIYETPEGAIRTFNDYLALANTEQEWSVVSVTSTDGGQTLVEEDHTPQSLTPEGLNYWLIHPDNASLSTLLARVTGDSFSEEFEEEELLLIGRGRKIDRGTDWGISGTLAVSLRGSPDGSVSGRDQRRALSDLRASPSPLWLRNPFGDVTKVALFGATSYERAAGVGLREFVSASIQYKEVA